MDPLHRAHQGERGRSPSHAADLFALGQLAAEPLCQRLRSSPAGLTHEEAARRLQDFGLNLVARERKPTILEEIWGRARNPLNALLLTLAAVSYFIGDMRAAIVIVLMVLLAVGTAFVQEHRSNEAAARLRAMVKTTASVKRRPAAGDGDFAEVPIESLVPGDIVRLSAGDMIPADLRLLDAKDLFINQSALTGEAMPAEKFCHPYQQEIKDPFDLPNMCFMGANVVSGFATGIIVRTGAHTFFGQLADEIAGRRMPTAFDQGVNRFTWLMIRFIIVMVPTVFLINGLTKHDWLEALLFAVAVAVGLTPEMLPMIVTVNLAKGAIDMSRAKVIVKRLNAIQNFGAMNILCTDKTGTLTQDRIILKRYLDIRGEESERVLQYAYLNSHFQSGLKNLLDIAVLQHVEMHGILGIDKGFAKTDEIPFDFSRRRLSVVVSQGADKHILICKGAVEEIFAVCSRYEIDGTTGRLDESHFATAKEETVALNSDGFRVVAVAYKALDASQTVYSAADERDLILLGYIAFLDPPKESAAAAIAALAEKGVRVKILTGDNEVITRKVCREVKLDPGKILLGAHIDDMTEDELADVAERTTVFAKLAPSQKERIVQVLHRKGHVVGFLGDGINDSPALKAADVGISVDTAVDIAKESADIINGRQLEFRQHVQRARGEHFPAVPADGADSSPHEQSALRFLPDRDPDRQRRRGIHRFTSQLGHRQHFQVHDFHRPDQLDLRLCDLRDDAVRVRFLDQSVAVSNGLVRGIAAHANAHHPHHSHGQDPVRGEPRESDAHRHDNHRFTGWNRPTLHHRRRCARLYAASRALLAPGREHAAQLFGADAFGEGMVRPPLGDVTAPANAAATGRKHSS